MEILACWTCTFSRTRHKQNHITFGEPLLCSDPSQIVKMVWLWQARATVHARSCQTNGDATPLSLAHPAPWSFFPPSRASPSSTLFSPLPDHPAPLAQLFIQCDATRSSNAPLFGASAPLPPNAWWPHWHKVTASRVDAHASVTSSKKKPILAALRTSVPF